MDKELTLGSLFSGSGGFELGGLLCGIRPVFASEIEPFPIRVTTKRLPQVKHLGDINKMDGAVIPPVDIITGGFCCQDLSVAGKRAGLHGERSGLFFQVIRIVREMREATDNKYPRFVVLENVPGMYSSNKGRDFQEVLNALIKTKDEALAVPMPESGRWSTAGEIVGDGLSLGWRTLDAQFFGVPQRRRRCFIVLDLAGERAGEILFDESRLQRDIAQGRREGQDAAGYPAGGSGGAVAFEPGAVVRLGGHFWEDGFAPTLRADMGDNQTAVVYDARGNGDGETVSTITGDHEGRVTDYTAIVLNERQYAMTAGEDIANTLTGTDFKGTQCVFEPVTLKIRSGCEGGGKGPLVQDDLSATLSARNDQTLFEPVAFGICSFNSHSMLSKNPKSGVYEAGTSRTLDTSVPDPNKNAGGMAIVAFAQNQRDEVRDLKGKAGALAARPGAKQQTYVLEGNGVRPSHRGDGVGEDVSFTLNTVERHAVCYRDKVGALCASDYKFPQSQQVEEGKAVVESVGRTSQYVVRRLTPQECAMLQGFPPWWCSGLDTDDPTEGDIAFWSEVWETHRRCVGTAKNPKTRNQIVKWLKSLHSDAAEYKMWGNGVSLPVVVFVLGGIAYYADK